MTEHAPDRILAGIDIPKTIAGVLATVSAAVLGSFLGVAGTLVGAALASLVGTIGTEVYHRSINKGARKLQSSFVTAPAATGTPSVAAARNELPSEPEPSAPRQIRWGRVAVIAASVFVLAIGTLTAFELVTGRSAADAVGSKSSSSTTIGSLLGGKGKSSTPTPAPSGSATPTTATPTTPTATEDPSPTEPTTAPTSPPPTTTTQPAETVPSTGQSGAGAGNTQNPQQSTQPTG